MNNLDFLHKPRFSFWSLMAASLLFLLFLLWLGVYQVEEATWGTGILEPDEGNAPIRIPGSGVIVELLVSEGQRVKKGDLLLKIDPLSGTETTESIQEKRQILMAQKARVLGLVTGNLPDFSELAVASPSLVANQQQLYTYEIASATASRRVFDSQKKALVLQREKSQNELTSALRQQELLSEEKNIQATLAKEGMSSRTQMIALERQAETLAARIRELPITIAQLEEQLKEAEFREMEFLRNLRRDYSRNLAQIDEELRVLETRSTSGQLSMSSSGITSPVDGVISGLQKRRAGELVSPNEMIMEIIPSERKFIAQIRIPAQQMGFIQRGLPVKVYPEAYEQEPLAMIPGIISHISGTSILDEKSRPYYIVIVILEKNNISLPRGNFPLLSGMTLNSQIITGRRTLLQYLFNSVLRSTEDAFKER